MRWIPSLDLPGLNASHRGSCAARDLGGLAACCAATFREAGLGSVCNRYWTKFRKVTMRINARFREAQSRCSISARSMRASQKESTARHCAAMSLGKRTELGFPDPHVHEHPHGYPTTFRALAIAVYGGGMPFHSFSRVYSPCNSHSLKKLKASSMISASGDASCDR